MGRQFTAREFIKEVLQQEISDIIKKHPYHAFVLEAVAIEFLGKALDTYTNWNAHKPRGYHFKLAIDQLFPSEYHDHKSLLYEHPRCGMTHFFAPQHSLQLIQEAEVQQKGEHLAYSKNDKLVLVIETLHEDFIKASERLLEQTANSPDNKINKPFLDT